MAINEIFPNPIVKQVAFEIRFPNLFFLESKIGEFQLLVMKEFPDSAVAIRRHFIFASGESPQIQETVEAKKNESEAQKLWQFRSGSGVQLSVASNSLSLVSEKHKSYRLGEADRFRDVISGVTEKFFATIAIPIITRIGLRYIDEGPIADETTAKFREYYNTAFPLDRFPIENAKELNFSSTVIRGTSQLRYVEALKIDGANRTLILDFDASEENVQPVKTLEVADRLHQTIQDEFERTIKQPVYDFMRVAR